MRSVEKLFKNNNKKNKKKDNRSTYLNQNGMQLI